MSSPLHYLSNRRLSVLISLQEALLTLLYFPKDTELALGMTLLELHCILQVFCVREEDGGGVNRGSWRHGKSDEFCR